jgi:hypothetical protein
MTRSPLLRSALALGAVVLAAGCGGSSTTGTPTPAPTSTASSTTAPVDAYTALKPPVTPGIGTVDPALAQRAYEKARGLLALSLAEPGTLTGAGTDLLLEQLRVPDATLSVAGLLTPRATTKGLGLRPLFASTVTLGAQPVEVVRSSYRGEEVAGLGGESGVRITWDGAVRYRVVLAGQHREVAYSVSLAYVFGPVPGEPNGLQLVQAVPGTFHAAPVVTSCLAAGVLLPAAGAPTATDYGRGPWPRAAAGPACPV